MDVPHPAAADVVRGCDRCRAARGLRARSRSTASAPFQHLYYMPIIFAGVMFRMRGSLLARSLRSCSITWRTLTC